MKFCGCKNARSSGNMSSIVHTVLVVVAACIGIAESVVSTAAAVAAVALP